MRALLGRLRRERGIALPMALVVMTATGAMLVSVVEFSSSSGRTASVANTRMGAEALAEAGIANALAVLNYWDNATLRNNASDPTLLGCDANGANCVPIVSTYGTGTATWYGVLNTTTSIWTITSTGSLPNPTGGPALKKTLKATVAVAWNNTQPANAAAWNYVFSTAPPGPGCEVDLAGEQIEINTPFLIRGDLCLTGTAGRFANKPGVNPPTQPIDLRVGGKVAYIGVGSTIGKNDSPIWGAAVAGGCATSLAGATHPCSLANGDSYYVQNPQTYTEPTVPTADFAAYYASAKPGPNQDCVTAANPANLAGAVFDNDSTMNGTSPSFDLTPPAASYQCKVYSGSGILIGELTWNMDTKQLRVAGTLFFDGPVTSSSEHADYIGSATLYVNGGFSLTGVRGELCANTNCNFDTWNSNTAMLMIVASASGNAITMAAARTKFQGGIFCNPDATVSFTGDDIELQGPVICGKFVFGKDAEFRSLPVITELPIGAPMTPNVHAAPATPVYGG